MHAMDLGRDVVVAPDGVLRVAEAIKAFWAWQTRDCHERSSTARAVRRTESWHAFQEKAWLPSCRAAVDGTEV